MTNKLLVVDGGEQEGHGMSCARTMRDTQLGWQDDLEESGMPERVRLSASQTAGTESAVFGILCCFLTTDIDGRRAHFGSASRLRLTVGGRLRWAGASTAQSQLKATL
jgi:hypothetical protein